MTATITAGCARCSWGARGREAAVLRIEVDGRYSQHVVLVKGDRPAEYPVLLGPLAAGPHRLTVFLDRRATPRAAGEVTVGPITFRPSGAGAADHAAVALAPFLYVRPGTLERKSDLPVLTWYETEKTARGERIRYSVIFTNEDGGTPVDRLMATWGRTTDVEFVYAVGRGRRRQGARRDLPGQGSRAAPLLGPTGGPASAPLGRDRQQHARREGHDGRAFRARAEARRSRRRSREAVMDSEPWTYRVSAEEIRREGRVPGGRGGGRTDPGSAPDGSLPRGLRARRGRQPGLRGGGGRSQKQAGSRGIRPTRRDRAIA